MWFSFRISIYLFTITSPFRLNKRNSKISKGQTFRCWYRIIYSLIIYCKINRFLVDGSNFISHSLFPFSVLSFFSISKQPWVNIINLAHFRVTMKMRKAFKIIRINFGNLLRIYIMDNTVIKNKLYLAKKLLFLCFQVQADSCGGWNINLPRYVFMWSCFERLFIRKSWPPCCLHTTLASNTVFGPGKNR